MLQVIGWIVVGVAVFAVVAMLVLCGAAMLVWRVPEDKE